MATLIYRSFFSAPSLLYHTFSVCWRIPKTVGRRNPVLSVENNQWQSDGCKDITPFFSKRPLIFLGMKFSGKATASTTPDASTVASSANQTRRYLRGSC